MKGLDLSLDLNVKAENGQNEGDEIDELASAQNTKHTIYQNVLQYFFNLIQGKQSFATNYVRELLQILSTHMNLGFVVPAQYVTFLWTQA
jgi:hypothetical protein